MGKSKKSSRPVNFKPFDVFVHAARFEICAIFLLNHPSARPTAPTGNTFAAMLVSPAIASFAVELYLKALVFHDSNMYRDDLRHDVAALFRELSPGRVAKLEVLFEEEVAQIPWLIEYRRNLSANPMELRQTYLEGVLETASQAFQTMRYQFEGKSMGLTMPLILCRALRRAILKGNADWSRLIEPELRIPGP